MSIESGTQIVNLNLPDKVIKLSFRTPYETRLWLNGLRDAVETEREVRRSVEGVLKFNVATLYFYFSAQMDNQIENFINSLSSGLLLSMSPAQFSTELKKVATEFGYLCDAFYARKPFVMALFKFVVTGVHRRIRNVLTSYWNKFQAGFQAGEVVLLTSAVAAYSAKLTYWKICDDNFSWQEPLFTTFISRLFKNSTAPITNILADLAKSQFTENAKLLSGAASQLESHILFVWANYTEVKLLAFA